MYSDEQSVLMDPPDSSLLVSDGLLTNLNKSITNQKLGKINWMDPSKLIVHLKTWLKILTLTNKHQIQEKILNFNKAKINF